MRRFRRWLAGVIMPEQQYEETEINADTFAGDGFRSGIDFSVKHVHNGYIISTRDHDVSNTRRTQTVEASDVFKQYIVPDGEDLLPHIISILAVRKLK